MSVGPIQLIAFGFEDYEPSGEILRELSSQVQAGAIRLIDAQVVRKDRAGHTSTTSMSGLSEAEAMEFGAVIGGLLGGVADPAGRSPGTLRGALATIESSFGMGVVELQEVTEQLRPGGAAAILVIEHTWATGFSRAIQNAGGRMLAQGFLTRDALLMVGEELEAQAEAAASVHAADVVKVKAAHEAARAIILSEAVKTRAAREAVLALAEARLVEEAAIDEAAAVVATALAVEVAAEQEAAAAVVASDEIVFEAVAEAEAAVVEAEATVADADRIAEEAITKAKEERKKRPTVTAHELSYIEGIGPAHAKQLKEAGIGTTLDLLDKGATPSGRNAIVNETGISMKLILKWVNHADLFRVRGIGSEYAELLEAADVDTVVELATRNPENLHNKLVEVNEEKRLVRNVPAESQVREWVERAAALPRVLTY